MARKTWSTNITRTGAAKEFVICEATYGQCWWIDLSPTGPFRIEYEEGAVPPPPPTPPPTPSVVSIGLNPPSFYGNMATVNGRVSTSAAGCTIKEIEWNWGDGSKTDKQWFPATHAYAKAGLYNITATGRDTCGNSATKTTTLQVGEPEYKPVKVRASVRDAVTDVIIFDAMVKIGDFVRGYTNAEGRVDIDVPLGAEQGWVEASHDGYESDKKLVTFTPPDVMVLFELKKIETARRKEFREFAENPDVIKLLGTLSSTAIESFSRVFSGWSYIDDVPADPRPQDYGVVIPAIVGVAVLSAGTIYSALAALPSVGTLGESRGMVGLGASAKGASLTSIVMGIVSSSWFKLITGASFVFMAFWNLSDPIWWQAAFVKMSGDVKARFNALRINVETKIKQAYNLTHITPTPATKAEALSLLRVTKPLIEELFKMLSGKEIAEEIKTLYPEFEPSVIAFATQYNDLVTLAGGTDADYISGEILLYVKPIPLPEIVVVENVQVEDGDTIEWPLHPEGANKIRFVGIDTHEVGTEAGKEESDYLKSLIEGKTITVKVDPFNQLGLYGRLLGVPFLDGVDISMQMLKRFGDSIFVEKKYRDKHKYIDWDLYEAAAKGLEGKIGEIKIYTTPAYASIWIDGNDTGKISIETFELTVGKHEIRIKKSGYSDYLVEEHILANQIIERKYELSKAGLDENGDGPVTTEEFMIHIDSEPSNAKLYIDNVYAKHLTPSDETELKDVMYLLTPGTHIFKVTKANMAAEKTVDVLPGANPAIMLTLGVPGLLPDEPPDDEEPPEPPPLPPDLPPLSEWSPEMRALAFAIISEVDELTKGALQLSASELEDLKYKYGVL